MSAPFDTSAAIAQANKWTEAGAHLVRAMLELDSIRGDVRAGRYAVVGNSRKSPYLEMTQAMNESDTAIETTFDAVAASIVNLRRVIVESVQPECPLGTDEAEWCAHEVTCAAIESAVISVGALIKKMEMEA